MHRGCRCALVCMLIMTLAIAEILLPAHAAAGKLDDYGGTMHMSDTTRSALIGTGVVLAAAALGLMIWATVKDNREKEDRKGPAGMDGPGLSSGMGKYHTMIQPVFIMQEHAHHGMRSYGLGFQKNF